VTPAVDAVRRAELEHRVLSYEHDPGTEAYGTEAAAALGLDPRRVFKTLVAVVDGRPTVALVPVERRLDLKALARAAGGKRAEMANASDAERWTGYVVGGISPLGQRKRLVTFVDASAAAEPLLYVSAGRRGLELELRVEDLLRLTGAHTAAIAG
jgi:Cys-tRNA(Pro)/Cys-tRNA(Cys) deacylase